jgi:hypothetical protein
VESTVDSLVSFVKLNNLQFNANRDPQVYRRVIGVPFRIQAFLRGAGRARCTLRDASGAIFEARDLSPPGPFEVEVKYDRPGQHVVTLEVTRGSEHFAQDLRLDVLEHAWIG